MAKKKTYQFDLEIRLVAEAESVDSAFEAALGKLDPDWVQIRSEVTYKEVTAREARIDPDQTSECGTIKQDAIGISEGMDALMKVIFGPQESQVPNPDELLKETMGEDN